MSWSGPEQLGTLGVVAGFGSHYAEVAMEARWLGLGAWLPVVGGLVGCLMGWAQLGSVWVAVGLPRWLWEVLAVSDPVFYGSVV